MFEQYPVLDMYVGPDDGQLYANVIQWDANGQPRYLLQSNEVVIDSPSFDLNYNDQALEIVNSQNRPIFQFIYKNEAHIIVRGIFTVPGGFLVIDDTGRLPTRLQEVPKDVAISRIFKYPSWQHRGEYETPASAQDSGVRLTPSFKVTVPVTGQPGLVKLDVNFLRVAQPDEDTGVLFAVRAEFENVPSGKAKVVEVKDVWAHITYREFDFLNAELARVASGCWIDQPTADVDFPVRVPRYLMLGAWHVDKGKQGVNEFRIFEYSRDLHRAIEKDVKILGPRVPFIKKDDQIAITQRRIVVDVVLTSNGHHDDSCQYQFHLTIFGGDGTGHGIACVKQPSFL